jgi:hypothetical protein
MEGAAGVKDTGRGMDRVQIAPRWAAGSCGSADVTVKIPAGNGYVSYRYRAGSDSIEIDAAANASSKEIRILLPGGTVPKSMEINGEKAEFTTETVENSLYACHTAETIANQHIILSIEKE